MTEESYSVRGGGYAKEGKSTYSVGVRVTVKMVEGSYSLGVEGHGKDDTMKLQCGEWGL